MIAATLLLGLLSLYGLVSGTRVGGEQVWFNCAGLSGGGVQNKGDVGDAVVGLR